MYKSSHSKRTNYSMPFWVMGSKSLLKLHSILYLNMHHRQFHFVYDFRKILTPMRNYVTAKIKKQVNFLTSPTVSNFVRFIQLNKSCKIIKKIIDNQKYLSSVSKWTFYVHVFNFARFSRQITASHCTLNVLIDFCPI